MNIAHVQAHSKYVIGPVQRRIFGSFVEHMGRCVYEGIYEPGHRASDSRGFRKDVLELARELGVTVIRYPGGNFVSGFRWEDSVGPIEQRPTRLDLAWKATDTNKFGLHEFIEWIHEVGAEPLLALNLGTRGTQDALNLLEYCNFPGHTEWSDKRIADGRTAPFNIRMWCLGNEMDGPWQLGNKSAQAYGQLASETAQAMKRFDKDLLLVACGSSHRTMPTFGRWEATVLDAAFDHVDYISLHAYYDPASADRQSYLCSAAEMEAMIVDVIATADHVAATHRSPKRLMLSFDEWNVAPHTGGEDASSVLEWTEEPRHLSEAIYTVDDAIVVGSLLITLLNHSDRIGIACQAQLANVLAPIMTEEDGRSWRQTIFYPFALMSRHSLGKVLNLRVESPLVETELFGRVESILATVTADDATGSINIFLVNRDAVNDCEVSIDLVGLGVFEIVEQVVLHDADPLATNSAENPERVLPRQAMTCAISSTGTIVVPSPARSWQMIRMRTPGDLATSTN